MGQNLVKKKIAEDFNGQGQYRALINTDAASRTQLKIGFGAQ